MRFVHILNVLLLAGLIVACALTYPGLPDQFPTHFGIDGQPDDWSEKNVLLWFLLPGIGIVSAVFMYAVARSLDKYPKWLNMPNKEKFLQLPPERQKPVYDRMRGMLYWFTFLCTVLFAIIQLAMWQGAHHGAPSDWTSTAVLVLALGLGPAILIIFLPGLYKEIDRQAKAYQAEGGHIR